MAIRLSMLLTADGRQAIAETQRLQESFKATAGAGFTIGTSAQVSGAQLGKLTGKVNLATAQFTEFKAAQIQSALAAGKLTNANKLSGGSVSNLTAQFNDIGVMLAAGQNPLQLAIQQGTQITQVIGPMGAAGAAKALKAAFVGMLSPVTLITIGTIAAGAALFQYASNALSAGENTDLFKEALKGLEDQAEKAEGKLALLRSGLASIEELRVSQEKARLEARAEELRSQIVPGARFQGGENAELRALEAQILAIEQKLQAQKEAETALAEEEARLKRITNAYVFYAKSRIEGEQQIKSQLVSQYALYGETRAEAETLSQQLLEAYRAGGDFSDVNLETGVDAAAAAAAALAQDLGVSLQAARGMVALGTALAAPSGPDQARSNVRGTFSGIGGLRENDIVGRTTITPKKDTKAATALQREREAVGDLTQSLRDQLAILRETDPVQKEMIRNRESLESATANERNTIEGLITTHEAETSALERKQSAWDLVGSSASGVLDGLFDKSQSLGDVLRNLASQVLDVAIQGQLLGTGPFGSGGGGLLGSIFPALLPAKAEGGPIYGPGGPKDDKVLMWGSNGEFMMNAAATARHRPLLEMMNAGAMPGFANGGAINGSAMRLPNAANNSNGPLQVNMDVTGARGDREIEEAGYQGMMRALEEYDRETLPQRVGQIRENPRMRG